MIQVMILHLRTLYNFFRNPSIPKSKQLKQVSSSYKDAWIYKKASAEVFLLNNHLLLLYPFLIGLHKAIHKVQESIHLTK